MNSIDKTLEDLSSSLTTLDQDLQSVERYIRSTRSRFGGRSQRNENTEKFISSLEDKVDTLLRAIDKLEERIGKAAMAKDAPSDLEWAVWKQKLKALLERASVLESWF